MAEVVDADREVHATGFDSGKPDPGAEGVARDRCARPRGEEKVAPADIVGLDVFGDGVQPGLAHSEGAWFVVLRVGLDQVALAGGGVLLRDLDDGLLNGDVAAEEVDVPRAISSPQRMPVSMKVCTMSRCCSGIAAISRSNSSGVRVRDFRAMTFGSSVWSHGLWTRIRSRTARPNIDERKVWYFRIDRGASPSFFALVTQSCTSDGEILFNCRWPKKG